MLVEVLDQVGKVDEQVWLLYDVWCCGDECLLWIKMVVEMCQQYLQLYQCINIGCNDVWVLKLQLYLQVGQGGMLVVVGMLYLLGSDGVVEKLRVKGYKVECVCMGCKVKC